MSFAYLKSEHLTCNRVSLICVCKIGLYCFVYAFWWCVLWWNWFI